jgi:hypothetical protein
MTHTRARARTIPNVERETKMVSLGEALTILNIIIATGVIFSTAISWFRGGWVSRFMGTFDKIDSIERQVDDLHDWKDDADDVLVAMSKAEDGVNARAAKQRLGIDTGYNDLLDEEDLDDEDLARSPSDADD